MRGVNVIIKHISTDLEPNQTPKGVTNRDACKLIQFRVMPMRGYVQQPFNKAKPINVQVPSCHSSQQ